MSGYAPCGATTTRAVDRLVAGDAGHDSRQRFNQVRGNVRFCHRIASIAALCAGMLAPVGASAQSGFFISYSVLGIASCSPTTLQGVVTASYNLPAGTNNLFTSVVINGGAPATVLFTINPPAAATNALPFSYTIPTTTQPYSISAVVYPAQGGTPVGSGASARYTCNVDGTVTAEFGPAPGGASAPIPTLSQWALIGLAMLLALVSWVQLRRRQ